MLESGKGLLLWPDVKLSRQFQLSSTLFLLDFLPCVWQSWSGYLEENVRTTQAEVQFLCQRREGRRCGFD